MLEFECEGEFECMCKCKCKFACKVPCKFDCECKSSELDSALFMIDELTSSAGT